MNLENSLAYKLKKYVNENNYPFHMPGHKRNAPQPIRKIMQDIYSFDLTEVDGTDELYNASGIIKEAMDNAAKIYGSDRTYFLINGSTGGILASINSCCNKKKYIVMAANSHISAYHAVEICGVQPVFIKPVKIPPYEISSSIKTEEVLKSIKNLKELPAAVYITSPTYDGVISDIASISKAVHEYKIPLIVDEAHGAHLNFFNRYAHTGICSALDLGADIVIQSLHKTLPALTQTAILHVKSDLIEFDTVRHYLKIFSSSSPSYILMSALDLAIRYMDEEADNELVNLFGLQKDFRQRINKLKYVEIWEPCNVYKYDFTKFIIGIKDKYIADKSGINGNEIKRYLKQYKIELEMSDSRYALALMGMGDTKEGFDRLFFALKELDKMIDSAVKNNQKLLNKANADITDKLKRLYQLNNFIAQDYIYVYPPGIPIALPGEYLSNEKIQKIEEYIKSGANIIGI